MKQTIMKSPHVTFDESFYVINPPLRLIRDEIFTELEHHHINIGAQHVFTPQRVEP